MTGSREDDLDVLREENLLLREENERLRGQLGMDTRQPDALPVTPEADGAAVVPITATSPSEAKVALFLSLFRGREDVHAKRWESKAGKSGYAPACSNEWRSGVCDKRRVKCADCQQRQLEPLDERAPILAWPPNCVV